MRDAESVGRFYSPRRVRLAYGRRLGPLAPPTLISRLIYGLRPKPVRLQWCWSDLKLPRPEPAQQKLWQAVLAALLI